MSLHVTLREKAVLTPQPKSGISVLRAPRGGRKHGEARRNYHNRQDPA